ncbi:cation diffusion facilitator family transporter [Allostreptomyces psammosilenae]|uniref:Cobalt-zinc-cadmium efflux system protein n=1 Tax=Allostreptomyces psammosilenae TaxID=1892865 RepID=A0A852ZYF1_9ACTN|nr:cation diffusion facilitator family transporter [Allostreptomyces psammosilenae]NYI07366.1 cobalt-zinc-cadmium efflux system protein [Allostreptomyces psammosilenae]
MGGHSHGHGPGGHHHGGIATAAGAHRNRLRVVLALTLSALVAQVVGGLLSGSLALLADAGHLATDAMGIALALIAVHFANKPATDARTFGYARAEILAAVLNAVVLFAVGAWILVQSARRIVDPPEVESGLTVVFALVGLVANCVSMLLLVRAQRESLNVRGAFLEVLADTLGSVAVLVSAVLVGLTGIHRIDPIASALIGLMIVPRTWRLLREAVDVLLEATPKDVDLARVRQHILELDGVLDVHDLHAWTVTSGLPVLSAHVVVEPAVAGGGIADCAGGQHTLLDELHSCLGDHFDVSHCTFQIEPAAHSNHEGVCH